MRRIPRWNVCKPLGVCSTQEEVSAAEELVARLAAKGVFFKVRNNRLWVRPGRAYKTLSDADRATVRHHRAELKEIAAGGRPVGPQANARPEEPEPEPEPELFAYGRRVTHRDVLETFEMMGDQALADYKARRIGKAEAYVMAQYRLRQIMQIGTRS